MTSMHNIYKKIQNKLVSLILPNNYFYFSQKGYCPCCDKKVRFVSFDSWLRDYYYCTNCYSIPRERSLMITIEKYFPNWRELQIHESSPGNRGASVKLSNFCSGYIPSQYHPGIESGVKIKNVVNEDLENQSFKDESFDLVITQDVFEHLYNPEKAFKEIARTLKIGGCHIFTVPLVNKHNPAEIWAKFGENNEPVFLKTPEYHINPIDQSGSPVTMHWGYDIVDFIKEKSGLNTTIEYIYDLHNGISAEFNEVLVSKK
jgi:SAM-dependent methyltransferase